MIGPWEGGVDTLLAVQAQCPDCPVYFKTPTNDTLTGFLESCDSNPGALASHVAVQVTGGTAEVTDMTLYFYQPGSR